MSTQEQIDTIEISMEQAKEAIALKDAFVRLMKNEDFQTIVTEGYFEKEATRLVLLRAEPQFDKEQKEAVLDSIDAIGQVRQYFTRIMAFGRQAERSLNEDQATHAELLAEGS